MRTLLFKGHKLNIKIETSGLTDKEYLLVGKAIDVLGAAVNSAEFENFILKYTWFKTFYVRKCLKKVWYTRWDNNFRWNESLNRNEILGKIMTGAETLDPVPDKEIDIYLKVDRRNRRKVIGYTYPSTRWQWIYEWVFGRYNEYDVASNLMHEWCHKIGFGHERKFSPLREFTIPYAIGYFVGEYRSRAR